MGSPYNPGHDQGCGYTTGDSSFDVNNVNLIDPFQQRQSFTGQGNSSIICTRHDLANSQGSSRARQPPGQHQAEYQPYGQQITSLGATYSSQSADMSRVTSHGSYLSSTSSGQQRGGETNVVQRFSYSNSPLLAAVDMRRSRTTYSPRSLLFNYQTQTQSNSPQIYPQLTNPYDLNPTNDYMVATSMAQHGSTTISPTNAVLDDFNLTELNGANTVWNGASGYE